MTQLKSLAHPNWPYEGTPHEWRGFAEKAGRKLTHDERGRLTSIDNSPVVHLSNEGFAKIWAVYQKQNFGGDGGTEYVWSDYEQKYVHPTYFQKLNFGPELK